ncbi:MAG TPA: hypothetical protein VFG53_06345 [Anaeromyxobacter sp.]|nr:hypothetical protein [Anaeromyxobacter sp.]
MSPIGRRGRGPGRASDSEDPRLRAAMEALSDESGFAAVLRDRRARRAQGGHRFGASALKLGGKTFAMVTRERLVVKFPPARVDELVRAGWGKRFQGSRGRNMNEWFALTKDHPWAELTREAYRHARSSS